MHQLKVYILDGKHHRESGPAIIYPDGTKMWANKSVPFPIYISEKGVHIGCQVKQTIEDWDEWFSGDEYFNIPRNSAGFNDLIKLWDQFKRQIGNELI